MLVWGLCGKTLFNELEQLHVRAAKIKNIYRLDWYTPRNKVLSHVKWSTIELTYSLRLLYLAYDSFRGHSPVPVQALFKKSNFKYNFRRKLTFLLPMPKTDFLKKSISHKAANLWNSLDNDTRAKDTLLSFKCATKKLRN